MYRGGGPFPARLPAHWIAGVTVGAETAPLGHERDGATEMAEHQERRCGALMIASLSHGEAEVSCCLV